MFLIIYIYILIVVQVRTLSRVILSVPVGGLRVRFAGLPLFAFRRLVTQITSQGPNDTDL